jgi:hypothetical protein
MITVIATYATGAAIILAVFAIYVFAILPRLNVALRVEPSRKAIVISFDDSLRARMYKDASPVLVTKYEIKPMDVSTIATQNPTAAVPVSITEAAA